MREDWELMQGAIDMHVHPVVALNLALRFIKPLAIKGRLLNQCHLLD
jgi:hypothetical protein